MAKNRQIKTDSDATNSESVTLIAKTDTEVDGETLTEGEAKSVSKDTAKDVLQGNSEDFEIKMD